MGIEAVLRNFDMHRAVTSIVTQITVLQAEGAVEYSLAGHPYEHCIHAGLNIPCACLCPKIFLGFMPSTHSSFMGFSRQP